MKQNNKQSSVIGMMHTLMSGGNIKTMHEDKRSYIRKDVFGWYDQAISETPAHDPGLTAICPLCANKLSAPLKTISFLLPGDNYSYFYRAHKSCYETATHEEIVNIESGVIDRIKEE